MKKLFLFKNLLNVILTVLIMSITSHIFAAENITSSLQPINVNLLISGQRTLLVGRTKDFPPFYYATKNNQTKGMDADIFNLIAKKAGFKRVRFIVFNDFEDLAPALKNGEIDVIANGYWVTPKRQQSFLFTIPYYRGDGLAIIYLKNSGSFNSMNNLKEHTIGVLDNSYGQEWVGIHYPQIKRKDYDDLVDLWSALKNKEIDAALLYNAIAFDKLKEMGTSYQQTLLQHMEVAYVLRKQDKSLQQALNKAINGSLEDGSLNKAKQKYLEPVSP